MPTLSRDYLALKFRQNWLAKHPNDVATPATGLDDSLTSLNWLQNLNILKIGAPTPPASPPPQQECLQLNTKDFRVNPNSVLNIIPQIKQEPGTANRPSPCVMEVAPPVATTTMDKVDYKTNPYVKPPYSYATLICMAMRESKKSKITLSGIYNWITENFMYYRMADPSWQNSIRHNLSLNKCFGKVPRRKDEPGKGGFWRINPDYSDMFVNGIFKKRRGSTRENIAPLPKKIKKESEDKLSSCGLSSQEQLQQAGSVLHLGDMEEILKGDFSWNAILNQDIEVGGVRIKTEDIINDTETSDAIDSIASPITSFSPPHSDTTSDSALDDLLSTDLSLDNMDFDPSQPLDLSCGGPLDLTVQGVSIRAPDWWGESFSGMTGTFQMVSGNRSGLSTPSPVPDSTNVISHPWAETRDDFDDAIQNAFDVDNLFDIENIPSPNITEH